MIDQPSWLSKGSAYDKMLEYWDTIGLDETLAKIPELFPNLYEAVDAEYILRIYHDKFKDDRLPPIALDGSPGNQLGFGEVVDKHEVIGDVTPFKATGYLDKLSQREGEAVVVERKTTSQSIEPGAEYWAQWALNPQVTSYVWYLRKKGLRAGRVVVEVLRKPSTTVNKVFDKKIPVADYREKVMGHIEKKTLVARHELYVSVDQTVEWLLDTVMSVITIRNTDGMRGRVEQGGYCGFYAYPKHEKSCGDYGGCPFRDVCEGKTEITSSGKFCRSEKWLKHQGGK